MTPAPGTSVRVVARKWAGAPHGGRHWEYDAVLLGADGHGTWLGVPRGTPLARPGLDFRTECDQVLLVPPGDHFWVRLFDDVPEAPVRVYADITTPPRWHGPVVTAVDLDLDVVRARSGRVWIDDEDEFAQHRVRYGYPADVVAAARSTADRLRAAVAAGDPPFDGRSTEGWLAQLRQRS